MREIFDWSWLLGAGFFFASIRIFLIRRSIPKKVRSKGGALLPVACAVVGFLFLLGKIG